MTLKNAVVGLAITAAVAKGSIRPNEHDDHTHPGEVIVSMFPQTGAMIYPNMVIPVRNDNSFAMLAINCGDN